MTTQTETHSDTEAKKDQAQDEFFALAFRGGLLDTVMDLGVIHALMVSRLKAPNAVVGTSTGAISAAALAEILQQPTDGKKVARFRQFLNAYIEAPRELARTFLPDTNEVRAETPLKSIDLPIYPKKERNEREESVRTTFGLIRLINDLLSLRLRVSDLTRLANLVLWWKSTADTQGRVKRFGQRALILFMSWIFALGTLWRVTPITWRIIRAYLFPESWWSKPRSATTIIRAFYQWIVKLTRLSARATAGTVSYYVAIFLGFSLPVSLLTSYEAMVCALGFPGCYGLPAFHTLGVLALLSLLAWLIILIAWWRGQLLKRLLRQYGLHNELGSIYTLKQYLVRLFDRKYYGEFDIDDTAKRALDESSVSQDGVGIKDATWSSPKKLSAYAEPMGRNGAAPPTPIHVAPIVANLCDGEAVAVAADAPVVDAILGALAVVPLFKPVWLPIISNQNGGTMKVPCVDALNVVNEPIVALLNYLRWQQPRLEAKRIHLYQVAPFPSVEPSEIEKLPKTDRKQYDRLIDVVLRVIDLRRHQSAYLERDLATRFTNIMPKGRAIEWGPIEGGTRPFVAADITRIETDEPLRMLETWMSKEKAKEKRAVILKAVATGCRAALQVFAAESTTSQWPSRPVKCRTIIDKLRNNEELPGSNRDSGPGLYEVCKTCSLSMQTKTEDGKNMIPFPPPQHVIKAISSGEWVPWPSSVSESSGTARDDSSSSASEITERNSQPSSASSPETTQLPPPASASSQTSSSSSMKSPQPNSSPSEPWVTLLFSGGVFRGVFQVGMLNGLVQAGVTPRVFAGSSVGSIMAAMATRIFADPGDPKAKVVKVAETFLGLDRLILTDRFADLVRRFTLRAGSTPVSIRDLDHVFRLYDRRESGAFGKNLRQVLAGFERLLYLTPYDVERMARTIREGNYAKAYRRLKDAVEDLLIGYRIGLELLGTEPMQTLILGHVLGSEENRLQTIDDYVKNLTQPDRHLLITVTNLTNGSLDIIDETNEGTPLLLALLASSAFPAVFRPRSSGEVFPQKTAMGQFVDGGVMDNLPLLTVLERLEKAAVNDKLVRQPTVPHLLITGSLEPPFIPLDPTNDESRLKELTEDWIQLWQWMRQLRFNKKVDAFAIAQDQLRSLWEHRIQGEDKTKKEGEDKTKEEKKPPVSIRVATVKPFWLCSTFAFHPMLGFRQEKQAASIAHGCAATLATLASVKEREAYQEQKTFNLKFDDKALKNWGNPEAELIPQPREKPGACWFQLDNKLCPFYRKPESRNGGQDNRSAAVHQIYELCGNPKTHRRDEQHA